MAIGVIGRYWVGYHPQWFPTTQKNMAYEDNCDSFPGLGMANVRGNGRDSGDRGFQF